MSGPEDPGPSPYPRKVFAFSLGVYVAIAGWLIWRTCVLEPYSDMIDWAARWLRLQGDHDLAAYLWAPHNFHHLVWTLSVLDLDIRAFGGQGYLFVAVGMVCLAAIAAMMARLGAQAAGPGLRLVGGGVALALSLMGCHVLDANADINTTYVHALVFAVAAIVLADGKGRVKRAAAVACAVAAGLGSAAGLAVWPALAFGAWRSGRPVWLLTVLASGAGAVALYLVGEGANAGLTTIGRSGPSPLTSILLFVNYLGLPWMRAVPLIGGVIGVAVLGASVLALLFRGRREGQAPERTAVSLIVFSLATAVMAGLARTGDMAPALVPMRYAVFLIPLHVGLWVLVLPYVRKAWAARPRAADAALIGLSLGLLAHQGVMSIYALRTGDIILRVVADHREGRPASSLTAVFYPVPSRSQEILGQLRARGLFQRELRADPPVGLTLPASAQGISASSPGP